MKTFVLMIGLLPLWVGCGDGSSSGTPLVGEVHGLFEDEPFTLTYGVAFDIDPEGDYAALGKLVVWMGEPPLACDAKFLTGIAKRGIYASIFLDSTETGVFDPHMVELTSVHSGGMSMRGRSGRVEISSVTEEAVQGSVDMEDTGDEGTNSLHGTFEVVYCDKKI